jgi:hypothetical protein
MQFACRLVNGGGGAARLPARRAVRAHEATALATGAPTVGRGCGGPVVGPAGARVAPGWATRRRFLIGSGLPAQLYSKPL